MHKKLPFTTEVVTILYVTFFKLHTINKSNEKEMKILEEKMFEDLYSASVIPMQNFTEISVHCKPQDGFPFYIIVGNTIERNTCTGSRKEPNPPHAHILSIDKKFYSRFQIANLTPPQYSEDLITVDESDPSLKNLADALIEWCNQPPKRCANEGDTTNWEAMRSSWKDIQDIINEGLA